ncbi:S-adenosyl-L-methionine-dependent methyltransferase [Armillaria novae-zelandiae]|uniref:S-adenosyl-L-methionine-dependent methyltransferase n=1 Tax=Armillaria novae-zelandiae TaxID=153914 RepID=A0AA39PRD5_9AGAR|nr:S-adenosyl-L-methionine-dependent methyltransferase [Armillaria novae-zelandiae]
MLPSRILRSTVNAAEISFFSRLSSQWWDERGEFAFLHQMNPVRVRFIRQKLLETALDEDETTSQNVLKGLQVLDVGCGGGLLSESLARLGARTTPDCPENLSYIHASAESLLSQPKRYDVVCSMEVLEHVDNPALFYLRPSGHLFLSTISRTPLAYFLTILMAEDVLRRVAPGTHTYSKFIKPSELPTRTEAEVRGIVYNPLSSSWNLAPRDAWAATECNYMFWVRKPAE